MSEPKPEYQHGGKRPGAGRKAKMKGPVIEFSIRLPESQYNHLKSRAAAESISVAELLRRLIAQDMEQK
jgi:hypothetical protein